MLVALVRLVRVVLLRGVVLGVLLLIVIVRLGRCEWVRAVHVGVVLTSGEVVLGDTRDYGRGVQVGNELLPLTIEGRGAL